MKGFCGLACTSSCTVVVRSGWCYAGFVRLSRSSFVVSLLLQLLQPLEISTLHLIHRIQLPWLQHRHKSRKNHVTLLRLCAPLCLTSIQYHTNLISPCIALLQQIHYEECDITFSLRAPSSLWRMSSFRRRSRSSDATSGNRASFPTLLFTTKVDVFLPMRRQDKAGLLLAARWISGFVNRAIFRVSRCRKL